MGAPLYMFRWHKDAKSFLARHRQALTARPAAVFALGPFHVDEKEFQDARGQLDKELAASRDCARQAWPLTGQ
jgi:menaquinone-dependent protoporphyrinogen oxidase